MVGRSDPAIIIESLIECADLAIGAADFTTAAALYEQALSLKPGDPEIRLRLVGVYTRAFFDAGVRSAPYLMFRQKPGSYGKILTFDEHGMRPVLSGDRTWSYKDFASAPHRKGLITGNSTAAGSGASCDDAVLHNRLNSKQSETLWLNTATMGHNLFQSALQLQLLRPPRLDWLVVCGGIVDFVFSAAWRKLGADAPPYWGEHLYLDMPSDPQSEEASWDIDDILGFFDVALGLLAMTANNCGARRLFVLQPHLSRVSKELTPEERLVVERTTTHAASDTPEGIYKRALQDLSRFDIALKDDLPELCRKHAFDFIDASVTPEFNGGAFLFPDYIHLTDAGHAALASLIGAWASD